MATSNGKASSSLDFAGASAAGQSESEPIRVIGKSGAPDEVMHSGMVVLYRDRDRDDSKPSPKSGDWVGLALRLRVSKSSVGLRATKAGIDDEVVLYSLDTASTTRVPNLQWIKTGVKGGELACLASAACAMRLGEVAVVGSRALYLAPLVDATGKHKGKCTIDDDITAEVRLVAIRKSLPPTSSVSAERRLNIAYEVRQDGGAYFKAGDLVRAGQLFHEALAYAESARLRAKGLTGDKRPEKEGDGTNSSGESYPAASPADDPKGRGGGRGEGRGGGRGGAGASATDEEESEEEEYKDGGGTSSGPMAASFQKDCTKEAGVLWSNLSLLALKRGKPMQAEANASRAIGYAGPHRAKAYYRRALARRDLGKEDGAIQDARDGLECTEVEYQRAALQAVLDGILGRRQSEKRNRKAMAQRMFGLDEASYQAAREGKRRKGVYEDEYGPPTEPWSLDWCMEKIDAAGTACWRAAEYVLCCGCLRRA